MRNWFRCLKISNWGDTKVRFIITIDLRWGRCFSRTSGLLNDWEFCKMYLGSVMFYDNWYRLIFYVRSKTKKDSKGRLFLDMFLIYFGSMIWMKRMWTGFVRKLVAKVILRKLKVMMLWCCDKFKCKLRWWPIRGTKHICTINNLLRCV